MKPMLERWKRGQIPAPPVTDLIGARLTEFGDGIGEVRMNADARHHNPFGTVQGGMLCALADVALGVAVASRLEPGETFSTLAMNTTFLRPVTNGEVTARATLIRRGRTTAYAECELWSGDELVAKVTATSAIRQATGT